MKTIAICGSMKFKSDMIEIGKELEEMGYKVELPIECIEDRPKKDVSKEEASRYHFKLIESDNIDAIIVINKDKDNKPNYIGANSFAEIAFAFYFNKKIFLLQDIYEPYLDELTNWGATTLNNDIEGIKRYL